MHRRKEKVTLLKEAERAIGHIPKLKTTKRYRREKAKAKARIARELSDGTAEHEQANIVDVANEYEHTNLTGNESSNTTKRNIKNRIYSIGHSNHTIENFLNLLQQHKITNLVDIRGSPKSIRNF